MTSSISRLWVWLLAGAIGVSIVLRYYVASTSSTLYTIWSDRDLSRAYQLFEDFQFLGPELAGGGRTVGGAYYYFLKAIMLVGDDVTFIHLTILTLIVAGFLYFYIGIKNYLGPIVALMATAVWAGTMIQIENSLEIWNPAPTIFFYSIAYILFLRISQEAKDFHLFVFAFLLSISAQMHLPGLVLLVVSALSWLIVRAPVSGRGWLLLAAGFLVAYFPAIVYEFSTGFANLNSLGHYKSAFAEAYPESKKTLFELSLLFLRSFLFGMFGVFDRGSAGSSLEDIKRIVVLVTTSLPAVLVLVSIIIRVTSGARTVFEWGKDTTNRPYIALMVMTLLAFVVLFIGNQIKPRNFILLAPAAAILIAVSLRNVLDFISTRNVRIVATLGHTMLLSWTAAFFFYSGAYHVFFTPIHDTRVYHVEHLTDMANQEFGFDSEDIMNRILVFQDIDGDKQWTSLHPHRSAIHYLAKDYETVASADEFDGCLIAYQARQWTQHPTEDEVSSALKMMNRQGEVPEIIRVDNTSLYTVVAYRLPNGNCFKSFNNRYVLTDVEREIEQAADGMPLDGVKRLDGQTGNVDRFIIKVPTPVPTLIGIEMHRSGLSVYANIVSNDLRGFTGMNYTILENLRVEFENKADGNVTALPLFKGLFGSRGIAGNAFPPWRSSEIELAPGDYILTFKADNVTSNLGVTVGDKSYELSDNWSIELSSAEASAN